MIETAVRWQYIAGWSWRQVSGMTIGVGLSVKVDAKICKEGEEGGLQMCKGEVSGVTGSWSFWALAAGSFRTGGGDRMRQMELFYVSRDGRSWVSPREAGRILGVTQQRIYQLCKDGTLESVRVDGQRWCSERSVTDRASMTDGK